MPYKFNLGQLVCLKSDKNVEGAIISIIEGSGETRYQVFTATNGVQIYYESQIVIKEIKSEVHLASNKELFAEITAALIRNPSLTSLYSLNTARIDFIPHQFRPVLKFIRSDRPRLLIADGVGVGKTIEAGLILREMQARRNLESVLIICPKPLITEKKWENEMKRFDEDFTSLDGAAFRYCIKETDYEGEWPDKYKKAIIPYSLFDEGNIFGNRKGRGTKEGLITLDPPPRFDLVIVDEAHHIRNTSTYGYNAVRYFCDNAEAVIFLTATPVQLEYDDLYVLLNVLRPDLIIDRNSFYQMAEPNSYINRAAKLVREQEEDWNIEASKELIAACETTWGKNVISKSPVIKEISRVLNKKEITVEEKVQLISDIEGLHSFSNIISRTRRRDIGEFAIRKPITVTVDFTPEQKALHDEILSIINDMLSKIHCTDNTKFMMTTIRRQTASCLFGLIPLLNDILYRHIDELYEDSEEVDFDISKEDRNIEERIEAILDLATDLPKDDPKLEALVKIIKDKERDNRNKVMIFSSFKHTLRYLYKELIDRKISVAMIHGDIPDEERVDLRRRFELDRGEKGSIDVLLFSEVGCEGLDYQFCDCMVNYDLPWNPMKVEQRIGRIDRNGQKSENVTIFNMITPGTVDADIYERCLMRIGVFHSSIGDCEGILGEVASEVRKIADNFKLSEQDRQAKLQQMTDNKIRLLKEQAIIEERQKDLFGINVPKNQFDEELKDATNYWLSETNVYNLVKCYLNKRLDHDKQYILGDKESKTLRVSHEAKQLLLEDFRGLKPLRGEVNKKWEKWLKGMDTYLSVTFDSNYSKEDRSVMLITPSHPLVKQASEFMINDNKTVVTLRANTDLLAPGEYKFMIYLWKLFGEKEDIQIKVVAENENLSSIIFDLIRDADDIPYDIDDNAVAWDDIDSIHHSVWEKELREHREKTIELIRYKEESLRISHQARMETLKEQLSKAMDKKIQIMREGQLRIATEDFNKRIDGLEKAKVKADIVSEILAYGILRVEPSE